MTTPPFKTFMLIARAHAAASRRFDARLGGVHGLGLNDLVLLFHLYEAPEHRLRRIDLAEKLCLTPSGVTWLLRPLEKRRLVTREPSATDARVAFASLTPAGARLVKDALQTAESLAEELLGPRLARREVTDAVQLLQQLVV
jgi:DNA-binding MarR family transcriptional regulator